MYVCMYVCMYCLGVQTVKVRWMLRLGEPIGFHSGPNMNKDSWILFLATTSLTYGGPNYRYWFSFYSKSNKMQQILKFILRRSFRPSSGVQDCTYSNRYMLNRHCCLLASGYQLASRQQYLFDKWLLLYVQSWTPDDGRKDSPKHVECHSKIK